MRKWPARYFKDPWAARNNYIHVVLDRSPASKERFAAANFRRKNIQRSDRVHIWKLLEMQRHAMLMYTSCGWFFDELSGLETVQVIQYAGRVAELAGELFGGGIEEGFVRSSRWPRATFRGMPTARTSTTMFVKPARVDLLKLGAHYAMSSLFESYPDSTRIYSYSVDNKDYRLKRSGKMRLAFGKARFTSEITQNSEMLIFGVLHFGDHNLHGGVARVRQRGRLPRARQIDARGFQPFGSGGHHSLPGRGLRQPYVFGQESVPRRTAQGAHRSAGIHRGTFLVGVPQMYEDQAPLLRFLNDCGVPIPSELKATAEVALNGLLRQALAAPELDLAVIQGLLEEIRIAQIHLDQSGMEMTLRRNIEKGSESFSGGSQRFAAAGQVPREVAVARSLPFPLILWQVQNRCYEILQKVYPGESRWSAEFKELAGLLSLRVE